MLKHKNCGGKIIDRKCQKCGKTWKLLRMLITREVENKEEGFSPNKYRKRIRRGGP